MQYEVSFNLANYWLTAVMLVIITCDQLYKERLPRKCYILATMDVFIKTKCHQVLSVEENWINI